VLVLSTNRFVITVIGEDRVGIVAGVTQVLALYRVNIVDISQSVLQRMFAMIMLVDVPQTDFDLNAFKAALETKGTELGVEIRVQHEDAFRFMHRI